MYGYVGGMPYVPPAKRHRIWPGVVMVSAAAVMLMIWLIAPHIPIPYSSNGVNGSVTFAQMHGLCGSSLGQFGQLLDPAATRDCNLISLGYDALAVLFWGALALGVGGPYPWSGRGVPDEHP